MALNQQCVRFVAVKGGGYVWVWVGEVVPKGPQFVAEWVVEGEALMSIDIMVV